MGKNPKTKVSKVPHFLQQQKRSPVDLLHHALMRATGGHDGNAYVRDGSNITAIAFTEIVRIARKAHECHKPSVTLERFNLKYANRNLTGGKKVIKLYDLNALRRAAGMKEAA